MRLTTLTFDILKSDPKLGRAEALRRAMLAYMIDAASPLNAYPALGRRSWSWEKGLGDSSAAQSLRCGNVRVGS
jgi:hypothetical protein